MKLNPSIKNMSNEYIFFTDQTALTFRICLVQQTMKAQEGEQRYSYILSLTSALDGGGWSMPHPCRETPAKETRYPLYRRLGWPQGQSGCVQKTLHPSTI